MCQFLNQPQSDESAEAAVSLPLAVGGVGLRLRSVSATQPSGPTGPTGQRCSLHEFHQSLPISLGNTQHPVSSQLCQPCWSWSWCCRGVREQRWLIRLGFPGPRVRVGGSLPIRRTRGNVGSGFRHCHALVRETDDSSERTTERGCDGHCTRPGKITTGPYHSQFRFLGRRGFGGVIRRASPNVEELPALFQRAAAQVSGSPWRSVTRLLHRVQGTGSVGRDELAARRTLRQGEEARIVGVSQEFHSHWSTEEAVFHERGGTKRHGSPEHQVSRARQELVGSQVAPQNEKTLREL